MTADDVKFSFERVMDTKTGTPYGVYLSDIDTISAVDKYTLKVIFKKSYQHFPFQTCGKLI